MFFPEFVSTRVPKEWIEGTQIPTKIPCNSLPLNQSATDRQNEIKPANIKINLGLFSGFKRKFSRKIENAT